MSDLEELVDQILAIDSTKSRDDIALDLKHTKSVEATVNRIFDGQFLNGTDRDPSLSAFVILDSDEEQEIITHSVEKNKYVS
ncbi:MAG: hypothetical protein EXX96DRAFT_174920 [Benjaminiella poitrasii]|nr:MAG: hypothetical protein EXX96DRAFT_174920 [Benjaminiella poitrasii]